MEAQDAGSDVLQEEGGVFDREGNFSLGADSGLGSAVLLLVVVLDHKESLAEGASALLGQDSFKAVLDVLVLNLRDEVNTNLVNVALPVSPVEGIFAEAVVFEAEENLMSVIDLIAEEEVVLEEDLIGETDCKH